MARKRLIPRPQPLVGTIAEVCDFGPIIELRMQEPNRAIFMERTCFMDMVHDENIFTDDQLIGTPVAFDGQNITLFAHYMKEP